MTASAGHVIVKTLENHGIARAYLVPGESFLDVLDGIYDSSVETVICRHEGGAGFAALAEARLSGNPGVAMVTRGPGAANAMIAVHTAWQDATPLVLFVGLIPTKDRGYESFQEFSLEGWFGTTSKKVIVLDDPLRAGELVSEAFHIARSGRPGPVVIGLPEEIIKLPGGKPGIPKPAAELPVSLKQLAELDERIASADKPLIIAGGDQWSPAASEQLAQTASTLNIPVLCDWRAYDAIPHNSSAYAGWIGYGRPESIAARLAESDLHIFVGCGRSDVGAEAFTVGMETETVLVSPDATQLMHAGRADQHIIADPYSFTLALSSSETAKIFPAAIASSDNKQEWLAQLRAENAAFVAPQADNPKTGVDLGLLFAELEKQIPTERVVTYGAGNATIWGHRFLSHNVTNSLVGPRNGAMGLAIPALIAAGYVFPNRKAVAICGDGDFLMNGQELFTAVAAAQNPLVIVVDNGRYGTIVQHQQRDYPGRPSGTDLNSNPDFTLFAQSCGAYAETVSDNSDLAGAVSRALAAESGALLHVIVDRELMPAAV